ncbi:MAG: S41 family peptidase [Bauldia sp.]|nr:S41 family peptidase [Bauldia sp.]
MSRKATYLIAGAIFVAAALLGLSRQSLFAGTPAQAQSSETYRQLNLFGEIFERILADYVDEVDEATLIQAAIAGMVQSLDPHSSYLPPDAFMEMQFTTRGEFGGLGIEVTQENGVVTVVSPIDDTPAARAGILAGDRIIGIDGASIEGLTLNEAVDLMRGEPNTPITLTIFREGVEPFDVPMVRELIRDQTVRGQAFGNVGYVRLKQFSETTTQDMQDTILRLRTEIGPENLQGFILDLRSNPGGLLDQSVNVADAFIEQGEVLSTRGRSPQDTRRYNARPGDILDGVPMIVLVNGGSASASEIVAGALQDQHRATIIGTLSFGKGSVQTIIPLTPGDGALRLTTARYYTPSGRSIQAVGIEPDILVEQVLPPELAARVAELPALAEATLPGHLTIENGAAERQASLSFVPANPDDDTQLQFALRLLRGEEQNAAFPANGAAVTPAPAPVPAPANP